MWLQICLLLISSVTIGFGLQLNIHTSIGRVREEIIFVNGYFEMYFTNQEYHAIVPGTIDFPGQRIVEQNFFNSNERMRNENVHIRLADYGNNGTTTVKLVDPYSFLVRHPSLRYSYASRDRIEFLKDPMMNGMILSVQLEQPFTGLTSMTYLTRGLSWTPRYELIIVDEQLSTLRALADINNEHERAYNVSQSQLITGTVPLVNNAARLPTAPENQRAEFIAGSSPESSISISAVSESTNFGSYTYNVTRPFYLWPKSIKTFPFLSPNISSNYSLETSTYLPSGTNTGLFQRMFTIRSSEFLPAGIVTFYQGTTGITLGQGSLPDTPPKSDQRIQLGNDPDVRYSIVSVVTATRHTPVYGQDVNMTITITNRKDKQRVNTTLIISSGYRNQTFTIRKRSSSNIIVTQDLSNPAAFIVRAKIAANQEESCFCTLKQSH